MNLTIFFLADRESRTTNSVSTLPCHGRPCTTCGRCSDWYYTGRAEDWEWIRNIRKWNRDDLQLWRSGNYRDQFKLHKGATCNRSIHYKASYIVHYLTLGTFDGSLLVRHLCPCAPVKQK